MNPKVSLVFTNNGMEALSINLSNKELEELIQKLDSKLNLKTTEMKTILFPVSHCEQSWNK